MESMPTGGSLGRSGSDSSVAESLAMAETAALPQLHFTVRCRTLALRTGAHAVDISPAGMAGPDVLLTLQWGCASGVMLLNPQIPYRVPGTVESANKLWLVVLQSLAPLGVTGPHRQHAPLEEQGAAVRRHKLAGD